MKREFARLMQIKGFLDEEEGQRLYEMGVQAAGLGPCLEIGSYCGKSTVYLGVACREAGSILFSVDHHRGSEEHQPGEQYFDPELYDQAIKRVDTLRAFQKTLASAGLENTVVPMVCRSEVAARAWATPLGLVFIDGGHSFEASMLDYTCWVDHVRPKGYLLIHDIFKDPEQGGQAPYEVYRRALDSGLFQELPMVKTLGALQRIDHA
jgi:hypothetical protein